MPPLPVGRSAPPSGPCARACVGIQENERCKILVDANGHAHVGPNTVRVPTHVRRVPTASPGDGADAPPPKRKKAVKPQRGVEKKSRDLEREKEGRSMSDPWTRRRRLWRRTLDVAFCWRRGYEWLGPDADRRKGRQRQQKQQQQFTATASDTTDKVTGKRPFEAMTAQSTDNIYTESSNNSSGGVLTISDRIVRWTERYFNSIKRDASQAAQSSNDDYFRGTFLPPVYCQHQGHSRTIVGVQYSSPIPSTSTLSTKKTCLTNSTSSMTDTTALDTIPHNNGSGTAEKKLEQLLVFNPSSDATLARDSLLQGTLRWRPQICKNLNSFQKDSYQLVYVAPGIMTEQERLRSRVLVGTHETATFLRTL